MYESMQRNTYMSCKTKCCVYFVSMNSRLYVIEYSD